MHTFISVFLGMCALFVPPLVVAAESVPAPVEHPNVTPPTKAPTTLLPPTPLPGEETVAPAASGKEESAIAPPGSETATENLSPLILFVGGAIAAILTIAWHVRRRKY